MPEQLESGEQARDSDTQLAGSTPPRIPYSDLAALFEIHFATIRRAHAAVSRPGLLCLVFDLGDASLIGTHLVKARADAISAMTVGRHSRCELSLTHDRELSLRHVCMLVYPLAPEAPLRFRVVDLRTALGFSDCLGNRLEAVEAEGPALLVLGRYALLLLPASGAALPETASRAWEQIGDPLYLECRSEAGLPTWEPEASAPHAQRPLSLEPPDAISLRPNQLPSTIRTLFTVLEGPVRPSGRLASEGEELGVFEVEADGDVRRLPVRAAAADRGLLVGSYQRCDDPCLAHVCHPAISRVHLLVIRCAGALYAVDTASSNGSFVEAGGARRVRTRVVKLSAGLELTLADMRARLRWLPQPTR